MKPDIEFSGRPFGGLGFICNKRDAVSDKSVEVTSDRISIIDVLMNSSYIDHVLMPSYLMDRLSQCEILCHDSYNVSDHLAIKTSL